MKRRIVLAAALVCAVALAGCAGTYKQPASGATLTVVNPTELTWKLVIDGKRAGKIGPKTARSFRIGSGRHSVKAVNGAIVFWCGRKRVATKAVDMGGVYSPNQRVQFILSNFETSTSGFLWLPL